MKGYFYYQNPGEDEIVGAECNVIELASIKDFKEGFVVSSFNKEVVYNLIPKLSISISYLDQIKRPSDDVNIIGFREYKKELQAAIEFCKENEGKVVLSRVKQNELSSEFSLRTFFTKLCDQYDHSFNYCFYIEGLTVWIGATPEVLVRSKKGDSSVYALAGSRDAENPFEWTEKEKAEQQFVTDTIADELSGLSIKFEVEGPATVRAGNLEHLLSEFHFETEKDLQVADKLHPTPAVCGIPREKALSFIMNTESHNRKFYAGIIGWKKEEELSLYVNLRCAEVFEESFLSYVGGGITKDSDPEKEWQETEIKSQTLLSILKKN